MPDWDAWCTFNCCVGVPQAGSSSKTVSLSRATKKARPARHGERGIGSQVDATDEPSTSPEAESAPTALDE